MGRRSKRNKQARRKRTSSSSSSTSTSSSGTPPPPRKQRKQVSGKETVSTNHTFALNNIIPEFDPLRDEVNAWLSIIKSYAQTFAWSDEMTRYQALNKLKGSAKVWYDSLLRCETQWPSWKWKDWRRKLTSSFQIRRNMFELLKEIVDSRPIENQSLYEFYFEQKCKIDRLSLEFSEQDIISIIVGNIGDSSIGASIEASNFVTCDSLASFLHGRTFKSKIVKTISTNRDSQIKVSPPPATQSPTTPVAVANVSGQPSLSNATSGTGSGQQKKQIVCYTFSGNHKKNQCDLNKCNFCGKRGHTETMCYHKKNANPKTEKEETKFVSTSNSRNKFVKTIRINSFEHEAFIDTGSSCSLISESLVRRYSL